VPEEEYTIPFGQADVKRGHGRDRRPSPWCTWPSASRPALKVR
jgi:hypothetical protein